MEQGSLKKTQTPGPRPRRAPINLYGIRMTAYKHLYYGVEPTSHGRTFVVLEPIRRAMEIWTGDGHRFWTQRPSTVYTLAGLGGQVRSGPAIQFLRAWPMTWNFGSGSQEAFLGQRLIRRMTSWTWHRTEH